MIEKKIIVTVICTFQEQHETISDQVNHPIQMRH